MYGTPVTGVVAHESGEGKYRKTRLEFTNLEVTMVDNGGTIAYGGKKVYDFNEGVIEVLGSRAKLTKVERTAGSSNTGIFDTFDGDFGVGTVTATSDASLATTEQNLCPTTATAQAVAGVSAGGSNVATTRAATFGTISTAVDVFLNLLVDDADHDITSVPSNLLVTGVIEFEWIDVGDNTFV